MTEKQDEKAFNKTLKRMLKTPPKPKGKGDDKSRRPQESHQDSENGRDAE